ncbi:zinc finger protein 585a [Phlyctema vagabunda]|uniref:Zinc finger protein 585a n=1 Tax=Phlyctema vagabunda TaxID=108571 RepID=A0ABR4P5R0_9HELO
MPLSTRRSNTSHSHRTEPTRWVWYCCQCYQGPLSTDKQPACLEFSCFGHIRCSNCTIEQQKFDQRGESRSKLENVEYGSSSYKSTSGIEDATETEAIESESNSRSRRDSEKSFVTDIVPESSPSSQQYLETRVETEKVSDSLRISTSRQNTERDRVAETESEQAPRTAYGSPSKFEQELSRDVIAIWHDKILPTIAGSPNLYDGLRSLHVDIFQQENDGPRIQVSGTVDGPDNSQQNKITEGIRLLFPDGMRQSLQIALSLPSLRRTTDNNILSSESDTPWDPRNYQYQPNPKRGASIGIYKLIDHTATLGGYVMVDGEPQILTVNHLIPNDHNLLQAPVYITHPSEQENLGSDNWSKLKTWVYGYQSRSKCTVCREHSLDLLEHESDDHKFYFGLKSTDSQCECSEAKELKHLKRETFQKFDCGVLGEMTLQSGERCRMSSLVDHEHWVEMDWALFRIDRWPSLKDHIKTFSQGLSFSPIVPGAEVKAIGRTSKEQTGLLSRTKSYIRFPERSTRNLEWTIGRDSTSSVEEWVRGGIGVSGDSGSWILDKSTNAVYGMVWGRDGSGENTKTLFTPIEEIIADIKERGVTTVSLPGQSIATTKPDEATQRPYFDVPKSPVITAIPYDQIKFPPRLHPQFDQLNIGLEAGRRA